MAELGVDDDRGRRGDLGRCGGVVDRAGRIRPRQRDRGLCVAGDRVAVLPLAPYVAFESIRALIGGERPDETWVGIALAASSVVLMPLLGVAKQRIADKIGSAATKGEGRQNMLCAYLAGALLVGLIGNALVGAWWLDPGVGLLIAAVAVEEGLEAWRGDGCCVSSPLDAAGFTDDACADDCCDH